MYVIFNFFHFLSYLGDLLTNSGRKSSAKPVKAAVEKAAAG